MKNTKALQKFFGSIGMACATLCLVACGQNETSKTTSETRQYMLPPNVTSDMLSPEYWLDKKADEVIMTLDEISKLNEAITNDQKTNTLDITSYENTVPLQEVLDVTQNYELPTDDKFVNGLPMPEGYMQALNENRNMKFLENGNDLTPQYAIAVKRTNMRLLPTSDFIASEGDTFCDDLQNMELFWNQPVLVLYESLDKQFYFVQSQYGYGWVLVEDLAFFDTREKWLDWQNPKDFLVVSTSRMRLDANTLDSRTAQEVYLGNVLPLSDTQESKITGRSVYGNYVIEMPVRGTDGKVEFTNALVPATADVHIGFLPYTQRNTLELAFTMLGQNYGWGGLDNSNDCSGYLHQIYGAMGFRFPRNSGSQAAIPCITQDLSEMDETEKTKVIKEVPIGSLLQFPGHIVMYLGERDGNLYVINSVGTWADPQTEEIQSINSIVINDLSVKRRDFDTWLSHFTTLKIVDVE